MKTITSILNALILLSAFSFAQPSTLGSKLMANASTINDSYNLTIKRLPAGIYYMQVFSENKKAITLKFIKQ
jgi:hypothetical protein